jgi:hypothetical protein
MSEYSMKHSALIAEYDDARQQLATMLTPEMFGLAMDVLRRRREVYPVFSKHRTKGATSAAGH